MKCLSSKMLVLTTMYLSAVWMWNVPRAEGADLEPNLVPLRVDSNYCDLDAPGNFHITEIGTNFISTAWEPVQGANAYYLKVVESGTLIPVADTTVTTTHATIQVPPGGPYDLILAAVAEGCPPSRGSAIIPDVFTLIVDLIVTGKTIPANVGMIPTTECYAEELPNGTFWFKVGIENHNLGNFEIKLNPEQGENSSCYVNLPVSFGKDPRSPSESLQAYIHDQTGDIPPCAEGLIVRIKNLSPESHDLFDLRFEGSSYNTLKLCVEPLHNYPYTYSLWKQIAEDHDELPGEVPGEGHAERNASSALQKATIPVSIRNPFTENLSVSIPEPASGPVCFQLFDLNGLPVLEQQFPAVQQYNLPTTGLPPGFYLLRIDAAGVSRTYKVVKAR